MIVYLAPDSHLQKPTAIGDHASREHVEMAVAENAAGSAPPNCFVLRSGRLRSAPLGAGGGGSPPYKLRRPISGTNQPDFRMPAGQAFAFETMLAQIQRGRSLAIRSHCKGPSGQARAGSNEIDALFQACP